MKKNETGLYYIYDKLAKCRISKFLEFPNNAVATKSFCEFLEGKEPAQYALVKVAIVGDDIICLHTDDESIGIVANGQFAKEYLDRYISELKEVEDVQ